MVVPPFLEPGDAISVVATARAISREELQPAVEAFLRHGLKLLLPESLFAREHQLAGNDAHRLRMLNEALGNQASKAILFARGGYGTSRMVDGIDWQAAKHHPKWMCGFSDLTVLSAAAMRQGICTLHSPMAISYGMQVDAGTLEALPRFLKGEWPVPPSYRPHPAHPNRWGTAKGRLIGGNLSLLCHLVGTPTDYDYEGAVLFIEDLDEYRYHIDRMLRQLKRSGRLARLAGLIVGSFSDLKDNAIPFGADYTDIIRELVADYDYPVAFGFPTGHDRHNWPLAVGCEVELRVAETEISLHYSPTA